METRFAVTPYDYAAAERLSADARRLARRRPGAGAPRAGRRPPPRASSWPAPTRTRSTRSAACGPARSGSSATSQRRSRITVHGDYDVDGVAATAVLVRALRTLGADVDWYLPSRIDDGYGLAMATVERLAARGTDLLVTVDCAITAVEEVAAARAAGLDVVVTDHHTPRADGALPDAPIVHPRLGGNPCPDLCATAVAHKLAQALLEARGGGSRARGRGPRPGGARHGGRRGAAAGREPAPGAGRACARSRGTRKPGPAGPDGDRPRGPGDGRRRRRSASASRRGSTPPAACTAPTPGSSCCSPRIRRGRARSPPSSTPSTPSGATSRRGSCFAAEAQVAEHGPAAAYVLAAEDWHPGRHRHRRGADRRAPPPPGGADRARRRRGHRLGPLDPRLRPARRADRGVPPPRALRRAPRRGRPDDRARRTSTRSARRSPAHAADVLTPDDLMPELRIDAIAPGDALTLGLAEELERLGAVRPGQPGGLAARPGRPPRRPAGDGRGPPRRLHAARGRRPLALRAVRLQPRARRARRAGRRGGAARGQPLERLGRAPAGAPPRPPEPPGADRGASASRPFARRRCGASSARDLGARGAPEPGAAAPRATRAGRASPAC